MWVNRRFHIKKLFQLLPTWIISMLSSPADADSTDMLRLKYSLKSPVQVMNLKIQLSVELFQKNIFLR